MPKPKAKAPPVQPVTTAPASLTLPIFSGKDEDWNKFWTTLKGVLESRDLWDTVIQRVLNGQGPQWNEQRRREAPFVSEKITIAVAEGTANGVIASANDLISKIRALLRRYAPQTYGGRIGALRDLVLDPQADDGSTGRR